MIFVFLGCILSLSGPPLTLIFSTVTCLLTIFLAISFGVMLCILKKKSSLNELAKNNVPVNTLGLKTENSEEFFKRKESELVANMLQDLRRGIPFIDS